jgi:hypothetical protein
VPIELKAGRVMVGCTTVAKNYLAYARVVAESWRRAHPSSPFIVLVLDGHDSELDVITPEQLGLDPDELMVQRAMYDRLELATALKPHLLAALLRQGFDSVVFVDPDMDIFGSLDDVGFAAADYGIALCPHVLGPIPTDGCSPTEPELQAGGVFNSGLIAVGSSAEPFLDWWAGRLARDCVFDQKANLFVDQRPLDWVPSYFPHVVLRDPALNVAYWNLHERPLSEGARGYEVGGVPLKLFHFSGFAPESPDLLTTHTWSQPRLRTQMDGHPALCKLCAEYAAKVMRAGHSAIQSRAYGFGVTAGGAPLTSTDRRVYRAALVQAERSGGELPPSPFDPARANDFARLVALGTDEWLPLRVRARLGQLRTQRGEGRRRPPPSSLVQRTSYNVERVLGSLSRTRRRQRHVADAVLLDLLLDAERRVGRPVTFTDEEIGVRPHAPS